MLKKSILVATNTNNANIFTGFNISLLNLEKTCTSLGIGLVHSYTLNEVYPQRGKNALCNMFMQSPCTHILFIDPDIEFQADDIIKMLEFNQPVVGGINHKRKIRWDKIAELANHKGEKNFTGKDLQMISREYNFVPKDDNADNVDFDEEFLEVDAVGSAVLLISKDALGKIQDAHPKDKYVEDNDPYFRFFDTDVKRISAINTNIYISDDAWFCNRWKEIGGKIYLYTKFQSKHWGVYAF